MPRGRIIGGLTGALVALGLTGCGVFYISPSVSDGTFKQTDLAVDIVPVTYETTLAANLMPNVPARLPLGFQPGAFGDAAAIAVQMPQLSPIPAPPSRPGPRPGNIPDRLPPIEPPQPYHIGVADVLLLSVNTAGTALEQLPGLITAQAKRQGFVVQDDGAIAIPDAGRVRVAGMTMQEAEAAIFQALVSAGIDPSFSLEIAEFNSQRVAVGGEVGQPMLVPITLKPLYLHEAISAAGGMTASDPEVAKIILTRDGETYQIGGQRFIDDPGIRQIVLRAGDSLYVESEFEEDRARARFQELLAIRAEQQQGALFRLQVRQAQAQIEENAIARQEARREVFLDRVELGAVERGYAYIAGEVPTPQRVALPFESTASLADMLFAEGGQGIDIEFGDYSEIYVLRRPTNPEEAGSLVAFHLNANNAANLSLASMFEMHPGDVVFVEEQPITAWNRA
ncbi:MAG TPA: polysaccharide biosynthesis/export family protein, partial [Paracoccaceae bacterium]|nr:polysaccharide biosynthesis/export family protein [Paracoccaceae bacterium]